MTNLFILGNGFDLAHGLPTKYSDFYNYLKSKHPNANENDVDYLLEPTLLPDGSEYYNPNQVVAFLISMISQTECRNGENWCDVENSLGQFDYWEFMDTIDVFVGEEPNLFRKAYAYEDAVANIHIPTTSIKILFSNWINSIAIDNCKLNYDFNKLIDKKSDLFLTFNYTTTLEEIYGVDEHNILHIHGVQGEDIIFGHGVRNRRFDSYPTGSEHGLYDIHRSLEKDTGSIIKKNLDFLNNLEGIKNIFSYGFSFSKVDLPYIIEICNNLKKHNITWYLSDFEKKKIKEGYKRRIKECGFRGSFSEKFSI